MAIKSAKGSAVFWEVFKQAEQTIHICKIQEILPCWSIMIVMDREWRGLHIKQNLGSLQGYTCKQSQNWQVTLPHNQVVHNSSKAINIHTMMHACNWGKSKSYNVKINVSADKTHIQTYH